MKPILSILLPSIRKERLEAFYITLLQSAMKYPFELIIVGPNELPVSLQCHKNIKCIRDFGSPSRAQAIALLLAEGEIVTWLSDDALLFPNSIDTHIDLLKSMGTNIKNVVVSKYREGSEGSDARNKNHPDEYFKLKGSPVATKYLNNDWWLFNIAFIYREFIEQLGGFNCNFEGTWVSHTDLAIRAQRAGAVVKMSETPCMVTDHMPGASGDHGPIDACQTQHDIPLFLKMYDCPSQEEPINMMHWKKYESVWSRRFNA